MAAWCRVGGLHLRNAVVRSGHLAIWDHRGGLAQCRTARRDGSCRPPRTSSAAADQGWHSTALSRYHLRGPRPANEQDTAEGSVSQRHCPRTPLSSAVQVRSGLSPGANEIRTRGPTAVASSVSGPCWSISSRARATHSHDGCGVRTTLVPESNRRSPCRPAPELPSGPNPISTHGHGVARQAAGGSRPPRDRRPDRP